MGLLDSLFSDQTYGGQGGGLLDFLRNTQMQNQQYQPGAGLPPLPPPTFADRFNAVPGAPQPMQHSGRQFSADTFDPYTYAPNRASPTMIGDYQMPRIGSADDFKPQQADIPPNAQPAQGQLPPTDVSAQSQQPQSLPPAFGGGGYFSRLQNGGSLIGSLFGDSPQQQNLSAQFQALVPILGPQKAMLAVMNPEAGKTLLSEALTNKEHYGVISEDPLAGKKYGFINERDQTINGQPISAQGGTVPGGGSMDAVQQAQQAGVKGEALYEYLPKSMQGTVRAMIEGRQPLPSTTAMRSPATLALIDAAHAIDPTFDATVWKARNDAGPDWTKGKSSEMVRAANQTLAHVGSLMDAMDRLANTRFPIANSVKNFVNEQTGGGEPGSFRTNAHAVAEEMSKVFKGANLSDSEIRHWEQNLSENMSPEQQRAQIAKLSELLHGSLQALEEKRLTAMGPAMAEKQGPLIKEEGQKVLARIDDWLKNNQGQPGNVTKTGVQWSVVK